MPDIEINVVKNIKMNIYTEEFPSVNNLLKTLDCRKTNQIFKGHSLSSENVEEGDCRWYGTSDYNEAKKLITFGYKEHLDKIKHKMKVTAKKYNKFQVVNKNAPHSDIVGYVPHVPNAIQNIPNSMINVHKVPQKQKTMHIIYTNSGNCGEKSDFFINAGVAMLTAVNIIEANGIQVKLDLAFVAAEYGREGAFPTVNLKNYGQRLDLLKICFPITHPSMLRRIGFKWIETNSFIKDDGWTFGYGRSLTDPNAIVNYLKKDDNFVVSNYWIRDHNYNIEELLKYLNCKKIIDR